MVGMVPFSNCGMVYPQNSVVIVQGPLDDNTPNPQVPCPAAVPAALLAVSVSCRALSSRLIGTRVEGRGFRELG